MTPGLLAIFPPAISDVDLLTGLEFASLKRRVSANFERLMKAVSGLTLSAAGLEPSFTFVPFESLALNVENESLTFNFFVFAELLGAAPPPPPKPRAFRPAFPPAPPPIPPLLAAPKAAPANEFCATEGSGSVSFFRD